ncbi:hypothetical protein GGF31_007279 [Allomyces arbusculus]|nr:hypothetical protein GGF31_007279 [Allomyces arbusculus]
MLGASMLQFQAHATAALQGDQREKLPSRHHGVLPLVGHALLANRGGTIYFLEQLDVGHWLAIVQTFKITQSVITPNNLVLLIKDPRVKQ